MTQEVLAEILGTSVQSISRWENSQTYPDISMLPIIANVFDVTIDELLNDDNTTKTKYDQELLSKDEKLAYLGDSLKRIELYREGLRKYPNNYMFMQKLAGVLLGFYYADDTNRKDVLLEVIKLSKKWLRNVMMLKCEVQLLKHYALPTLIMVNWKKQRRLLMECLQFIHQKKDYWNQFYRVMKNNYNCRTIH